MKVHYFGSLVEDLLLNCRHIFQLHHVHGGLLCRPHSRGAQLSPSDCRHPRDAAVGKCVKHHYYYYYYYLNELQMGFSVVVVL
jgi:hypothetical protein